MNQFLQAFRGFGRITAKVIPMIFGLVGLALVIAWISGVFAEKIAPGEAAPVSRKLSGQPTDTVHEVEKDYIEESVGTLKAASRSVISSKIMGTIQVIAVSAGDFVSEGDLLITLNTREQDARLQQALVAYQQTVLQAAQEVDDAMVSMAGAQAESAILVNAVAAARRSNDLSLVRYQEGFSGYQRVLDAQQQLIAQQNRLVNSQGRAVQSLVALYKALGGGWEVREGKAFVDENTMTVMRERTNWGGLLDDQ